MSKSDETGNNRWGNNFFASAFTSNLSSYTTWVNGLEDKENEIHPAVREDQVHDCSKM